MIELDDNCTKELWFTDINEKVFSFKQKIHNWLREGDEIQRIENMMIQIYRLQVMIQIIKFQIIEAIN